MTVNESADWGYFHPLFIPAVVMMTAQGGIFYAKKCLQ